MNMLRISLFGCIQIDHDDWQVEVKLPRIAQALLAYLLLERHRYHAREVLIDLFWRDYQEKRARRCLSTTLWRLRQALEPEDHLRGIYLLTTSTGEISFNWDSPYWLDIAVFEKDMDRLTDQPVQEMTPGDVQKLEEIVNLYTDDLLQGFYDDWAIRERERLRQLYLNGLEYLMLCHKYQASYKKSLLCGQQILDNDPLRESVHREMMRLYWENKQPTMAVRQYQICQEMLAEELNIAPMEETQRLYAQIISSQSQFSLSPPLSQNLTDIQEALLQLKLAVDESKKVQQKLSQATQLVEQLLNAHK